VFEGATFYTFPAQYLTYKAPAVPEDTSTGLQGVRDATYVSHFESEAEVLQRILAPMDAPEYAQGATPRLFRLYTLCRVSPGRYDDAVPRLKKVGINWIDGIPLDVKTRYGLITDISSAMQSPRFRADTHCPLDPTVEDSLHELFEQQAVAAEANDPEYRNRVSIMKMGDEIGPVSGPIFVNGLSDCRKAFHSYLAEILAREGESPSFFGVTDLDQVDYAVSLPADAGRYQKRVYYHSCLFRWMLTSTFYERYTKAVSRVYPNVRTSCNYTPGSFMHAGIMHTSDWFALSRYGGATMSWGEDWLGGTGWYAMAGLQTVGYYGAIVECAARKRGLPSGFYLVGRTGSIDRKMLSLAARGIQMIYLYNWGPEYTSGAVDTFSHLESTYPEIGRGARALGLIDDTLARGKSAPRKVALLYNQSHEFWYGAYAGMHFDRLLTFLALQHAHVPVNLILEEDLSPEVLSQYQVLYINGFNLQRRHLAAISDWVKAGGMLYASSGAAMFDEYNDPAPEAEELLGARQQIAGMSEGEFRAIDITDHEPIDTLQIEATDLTPSLAVPVVGLKIVLTPTTGQPIARYADGSVGAVRREFGRGKVLLLGVMPGHLYRHNAPRDENLYPTLYTQERRDLITLAATRTLPAPDVTYSDPLVEVTLIEDEEALAVLLNDFSYAPGRDGELRVRTDRKIGSVVSNVRGPIDWRRDGDHIVIPAPVPDPVESILLR